MRRLLLLLTTQLVLILPLPARSASGYTRVGHFPALPQPWYFTSPLQITHDSADNLYVGDGAVLKFSPSGIFLLSWDRRGSEANQYGSISGITVDSLGFVYISDSLRSSVFKFTNDGTYVTSWITASRPGHLAVDGFDRIYVYDTNMSEPWFPRTQIERFTSDGIFIDASPASGQIALDSTGNIYVANGGNPAITKFNANWQVLASWGGQGTGNGQFLQATGIAVDAGGNVYVADKLRENVQKFTPDGTFLAAFGTPGREPGQLYAPGLLSYGSGGNILILETGKNADGAIGRISVFSTNGTFIRAYGSGGSSPGFFFRPNEIAIDPSGDIYVIDTQNDRVQKFNRRAEFVSAWGSSGSGNGQFKRPLGIATDASGKVYVADTGYYYLAADNSRVQKFDKNGVFIRKWGTPTGPNIPGQFRSPSGISVNPPGNVLVSDASGNYSVQRFDEDGNYINNFGTNLVGIASSVAVDPSGNVFVGDSLHKRVLKFTLNGTHLATFAQGTYANGVCTDRSGFVYVTDVNKVQKFDSSGSFVETIGEEAGFSEMNSVLTGCEVAANGDLYVVDKGRNRVVIYSRGPSLKKLAAAAASAPGSGGTQWKTDVEIANTSDQVVSVEASLWLRGEDNTTAIPTPFTLAPGQTRFFADMVATTLGSPGGAGAIEFLSEQEGLLVSTRTYTATAAGAYGQGIPGTPETEGAVCTATGQLIGLSRTAEFRTNVGVVNLDPDPLRVTLVMRDIRGSPLAEKTYDLSPFEPLQLNDVFAELGLTGFFVGARLEVSSPQPLGRFSAYSSILDNGTGDPTYRAAQRVTGYEPGERQILIPAVARTPGTAGTIWRSDLTVTNAGTETLTASFLLLDATGIRVDQPNFSMIVPSGETTIVEDVLGSRFGIGNGVGALLATASGAGLLLQSRTYNVTSQGTYGQGVAPVAAAPAFSSARAANLVGVARTSSLRTNVGLVNLASTATELTLSLYRENGSFAASRSYTIPGLGFRQIDDVVTALGQPNADHLRLRISTATGAATFFAYASRVDSGTGDAVFLAAQ